MKPASTFQRAFSGGELAPALHARADQVKYTQGLRTCRNFIVQRHGGVTNRPGLRRIAACKTNSSTVELLRYVSEVPGESVLLELGNGYIRFFVNGAPLEVDSGTLDPWGIAVDYVIGDLVTDGGTVFYALVNSVGVATTDAAKWHAFSGELYELPSPFGADLPHWGQSGRTITLTHQNHPPYELINGGALTSWILRPVTTAPGIVAPSGLAVTPGTAVGSSSIGYVVTAAADDTGEESLASGQVVNGGVGNPTPAAPDVLTWTPVVGASAYYIYQDPLGNGTYGFLGTATGAATFHATSITPDYSVTPPIPRALFAAAGDYPDVSTVFQQRRLFGFTKNVPDGIFGSRTGFPSNFNVSAPLQNDDAITFRIAGNNHNPIKHLLGLKGLIVLTGSGEWTVTGGQPGSPLIPNGIDAEQQTYVGASDAAPVVVGNSVIYVQARGKILRDLQFDLQVEGLGGRDLSIFSDHLFKAHTITEIDFAQTPDSVVWCIRSDGTLLGLTYVREQEIWGWHRHDTAAAGRFEHVCVVPEATEDVVYVIVRRTIGGVFTRAIERLASRLIVDFDVDAFFVDAGLTYTGVPVNTISGLGHLNGQVVAVVGDGAVIFDGNPAATNAAAFTVTAGTLPVALPASYSTIHAGLAIRYADFELLDLDVQGSDVRDKKKRVGSVTLLLEDSARTFSAGPDANQLTRYALEPYDVPQDAYSGPAEIAMTSAFNNHGRVFIRHTDPLPLTILGVLPSTEIGG